jgi:hypothetical protein
MEWGPSCIGYFAADVGYGSPTSFRAAGSHFRYALNFRRIGASQRTTFWADSVEKVASLKSLQICQSANEIFD